MPSAHVVGRQLAPPALLLLLAAPILFYGLGSYSVVNIDEAFYHAVARHMVASGDWTRLEFAGRIRLYDTFLNAPLHYWAKAVVIALFGDNLWTMRILSTGFGLLSVLMTGRLAERVSSARAGLLAGLIQLSTFQFVYLHSARTGEMEPAIAFCFTLAAWLFLDAVEGSRGFVPHHLCLVALAHLKLPLAALPLLAEVGYFALTPSARSRVRGWLVTGLWLLPLAVAWRAYQLAAYGSAVLAVARTMLEQASGRDVGTSRHHLGALGNLAYYAQAVLTGAYPLSLLHPIALVDLLVRPRDARAASRWRLLALYPTATLAFFALVSKHFPWYVMPVYPFLCVFTGAWLDRLLQSGAPRGVWVALACAVAVAAWLRPPGLGYDPFQVSGRALLPVGWAHWGALGPALGVPATAALLAVILALVRARRPRAERVLAGALAACLLGVGLVRVLAPLRFVHYVSPMARLREQVDEARARGESIPYPLVYVKPQREEPDLMKLRYYFSDDFYIVKPPGGSRSAIVYLYERSRGRPPGRVS